MYIQFSLRNKTSLIHNKQLRKQLMLFSRLVNRRRNFLEHEPTNWNNLDSVSLIVTVNYVEKFDIIPI